MPNDKTKLKMLQNRIPVMKCKEGCTDCCGPIVFSKVEWGAVKDKRESKGTTCPYVGECGCEIYNERPILCRLFGTVPGMPCPHGCKPEKPLTAAEGAETMKLYITKIMKERKDKCQTT